MHQPTCSFVSASSDRTTAINGAMPNQAKKQRKNAIHDMWNARICGVEKFKSAMRVALAEESIFGGLIRKGSGTRQSRAAASGHVLTFGPLEAMTAPDACYAALSSETRSNSTKSCIPLDKGVPRP